ncbi:MAG TPA: ZIP family metal transporter [Gammaproteobacteria bacterium]|nr:ZIP family metal transporter [Gammaproteobacteria bacterium]
MSTLLWIIIATTAGGILSALVASTFLLFSENTRKRLLPHLVSFAVGALIGASLLGLVPHALEMAGSEQVHTIGLWVAAGVLLFFILEKAVIWRHCHADDCEAHAPGQESASHSHNHLPEMSAGPLVLVGDGIHNFVDGLLIGAAFLTDIHLGIVTALAVIAHEIPQEVGDVAVLLNGGFSRMKSFTWNMLVGFTTPLGGLAAWFVLEETQALLPGVLALAAGSFLYVAVADLMPGLHRRTKLSDSLLQVVFIAGGLLLILFSHSTLH